MVRAVEKNSFRHNRRDSQEKRMIRHKFSTEVQLSEGILFSKLFRSSRTASTGTLIRAQIDADGCVGPERQTISCQLRT